MKVVLFSYILIFQLTTDERDDTAPDWPPHSQATPIWRDEVADVYLGTALIRANNDVASVNDLQRRESNEPQRPTAADENCVRWMDGRN